MTVPVFVDTSAIYAVLDADDANHESAASAVQRLLDGEASGELSALTHSSVIVECVALVQRRLGMDATRALLDDLIPLLSIVWVDESLHAAAATALLAAKRRSVSLVDWTSFVLMRNLAITDALAFDADFVDNGFKLFRAQAGASSVRT